MIDETLPQWGKFDRRERFAERLPMRKRPCVALGLTLKGGSRRVQRAGEGQ
jgi:hypothetical protein